MTSADLLTSFEICDLRGYFSRDWKRRRLDAVDMLRQAITAGVTETEREDFGELAGETVMELGANPGMEMPSSHHLFDSVVHHAALADTLTNAVRSPTARPWLFQPDPASLNAPWASSAFLDPSGVRLRRIVLASGWSNARHYSEVRSWYGLGEVAAYGLPMTMVVLIIGQQRDGRRSGPFTRGMMHPTNHSLRFRKRRKATFETFGGNWEHVWREDRGEIETRQWLQAMLDDDILKDVCFTVEIEVPGKLELDRIRGMADRKLERLAELKEPPEPSMSVCDRPPCQFRGCCWSATPYVPSELAGFVRITPVAPVVRERMRPPRA